MSEFLPAEKALGMYKMMYRIRKYEESIYYLFLEGIMPGTIHQSTGEEASAVGMLYDLRKDDWMASTHRPAGHDIAKGISVKAMMCEMFGKAEGCCGGKGGAMHTGDISVGAMVAHRGRRGAGVQDAEKGQCGGLLLRRRRQQRGLLSRDHERSRPLEAAGGFRM